MKELEIWKAFLIYSFYSMEFRKEKVEFGEIWLATNIVPRNRILFFGLKYCKMELYPEDELHFTYLSRDYSFYQDLFNIQWPEERNL